MASSQQIAVIAHRGASMEAPELTVEAFDLALDQGAHVLELDVRLTADGRPVLVHDETLLRIHRDPRLVSELARDELASLPGPRPLGLDEVLRRYGAEPRYLIDLKCPDGQVEHCVLEAVRAQGLEDRVQIQAFCRYGLRRVRRLAPATEISRLYEATVPATSIRRGLPRLAGLASAIGPSAATVDQALVSAAHRHGLRVQPWTVNEPEEMERLLALGVDGLITDVPALAVEVIAALGELAVAA